MSGVPSTEYSKACVWRAHLRTWGPDAEWWWDTGHVWGTSSTWRGAMDDLCAHLQREADR